MDKLYLEVAFSFYLFILIIKYIAHIDKLGTYSFFSSNSGQSGQGQNGHFHFRIRSFAHYNYKYIFIIIVADFDNQETILTK